MPQIVAVRVKDDASKDTIAVVLSQDAICLGPDGQPWSGVSLNVQLARSLAERLLGLAKEIEDQQNDKREFSPSLAGVTSILVLHDGSGQSHRACELALDLSSRSLACIHLIGVYGVRQDSFEPSSMADDYEWQRGWLERLVQIYMGQAAQAGVDLRTTLMAADDQQKLSHVLDGNGFDLIVLPRRFSEAGVLDSAFRGFRQALSAAPESTILFCP